MGGGDRVVDSRSITLWNNSTLAAANPSSRWKGIIWFIKYKYSISNSSWERTYCDGHFRFSSRWILFVIVLSYKLLEGSERGSKSALWTPPPVSPPPTMIQNLYGCGRCDKIRWQQRRESTDKQESLLAVVCCHVNSHHTLILECVLKIIH